VFTLAYKALEVLAAYFAHIVLFQNEDDHRAWSQISMMPDNKASLIGNGIDFNAILSRAQPDARETVRREFGVEKDVTVITMVARLELYKGHLMLLNALQQLSVSTDHKICALFVGIGKDRPLIEEEVNRLGLKEIVIFTGYRLDVPNLLLASDISVLTSRYEGIPRALMESMALGIPVIATNVPGSRSLISSGENGILVEHDDVARLAAEIRTLIENPGLASRIADHGKQTILRHYDEHRVNTHVEGIYQSILDYGIPQFSDINLEADS
jgi:glycosyltransferase involved in cell wall biosynthesis